MEVFLSCILLPKRIWNFDAISYFLVFPDKRAHGEDVLGEVQKAACNTETTVSNEKHSRIHSSFAAWGKNRDVSSLQFYRI